VGMRARSAGGERPVAMLLGVFVAITLVGWLAGSTVLAGDSGPTAKEDINAAIVDIGRYRHGEDSVLAELRARVERCALVHHRLDAQKQFEFYVGMPRADRMKGAAEQDEFDKIYARVRKAKSQHLSAVEWNEMRAEVLDDLAQLIDRTIHGPDLAPAAFALGFRATLQRQRIRTDDQIDPETRHRCIESGLEDAKRSIESFTQCGMRVPQLEPLLNLGWFEWSQEQLDQAEKTFAEVKVLARSVNNVSYQARALTGLELIATERGDIQLRAKLLIEMASLGPKGLTWDVIKDQGLFLLELDEPRMAAEWLAAHRPEDDADEQEWHLLMYLVTSRAGMETAARGHAQVVRNSPKAAQAGSLEWLLVAEMDLKAGQAMEVLQRLDQIDLPWIDIGRRGHIARIRGNAQFALGHFSEAASVLRAALDDCQSPENRVTEFDARSSTRSIVGEVIGLESVATLARALIECGNALDAATAIENWQCRSLRLGSSNTGDVTSQDLKAWASRYEAGLVTWVIGADNTVVVHVDSKGIATAATLELGRHALEKAVRRLREAAFDTDPTKAYRYGGEIQSVILPPDILAAIGIGEGRRILICLHGPLEAMPLDLLPLFRGDQQSSPVPVVLPGLLAQAPETEWSPKTGASWSILGDPLASVPDDTVPGASEELGAVARLHPGSTVHTGPSFDREHVLAALQSHECLHLASHLISGARSGTSIDDSMSHAAILLSHGDRLCVDDIRSVGPKLDLAVLNACYTAGGEKVDAEPVQGIARAFLISGTRNIMVTMWPIEDEAAAHFAMAFHGALNEGLSPSRAAIIARNDLRSSGASPAEWAAFRLIGRD
jgi:hypothetical protein